MKTQRYHWAKDPLTALTLSTPESLWIVVNNRMKTYWHFCCLDHPPAWNAMLSMVRRVTRHYVADAPFGHYTETVSEGTIRVYDSVRDYSVADDLSQAQINFRVRRKCSNCGLSLLP